MNKIIELILGAGVILSIFVVFFFMAQTAFSVQEQYECQKWATEAKIYQGYYLVNWQVEQCAHYNVKIDTVVQK